MPLILIIIGAILIVSALKNTQGELATALEQDIPPFLKWAVAIFAIVALGWIPPLRTPSRWLLALVLIVIVLTNYRQLLAGFQGLGGGAAPQPAAAVTTPAAAYTQAVSNTQSSSPLQQAASATGAVSSAISGFGSVASDIPIVGGLLGGLFG